MESQIKIVIMSFISSIVVALIVLPILKKLKVGQVEREYGPRSHLIKQGTPTMGGIIIAITLLILTLFFYNKCKEILPLTLVIIGFGIVGFVDDFKKLVLKDTEGLKPTYKILRTFNNLSSICIIPNKHRNRDRNLNPRTKNIYKNSNNNIYPIHNPCNACWNKRSKPNRWNRWISNQRINDNHLNTFNNSNKIWSI